MSEISKKNDSELNITINQNEIKKPLIRGKTLLFATIIPIVIIGIMFANGLIFEGIVISILSGVVLTIVSLFWKPYRKATGLLNIVLGIILILSIVGAPFGLILLFLGGILFFI